MLVPVSVCQFSFSSCFVLTCVLILCRFCPGVSYRVRVDGSVLHIWDNGAQKVNSVIQSQNDKLNNLDHIFKFFSGVGLLSADSLSNQYWRIFASPFFFSSAGETALGIVLLFTFRVFEKYFGSRKFSVSISIGTLFYLVGHCFSFPQAALVFFTVFSSALQLLLLHFLKVKAASSGPYGIIFALLVHYFIGYVITGCLLFHPSFPLMNLSS